nr:hypothetical protein [Tanacetum cinerariifolium]
MMNIEYSNSELNDEVDFESSSLIESQKIKTKAELKRKMKGGSDSDSSSLNEEKMMRFSAFHNVPIDKIPSRLGRYMVAIFDSETYRLSLDSGDYIEVTPSKIHDILGMPVGGDSLFSFKERPIEHDFEVDFMFKVNFLTLFTNTVGKVASLRGHICLENVFKSHSGEFIVYGVCLNMGLRIDANVIDCYGAILNHEERFRDVESKARHFFPTSCINYGLPFELQLQYDMLRRLRFKFSMKILLHEVNVHAKKKLDLATEFDKVDAHKRMSIIVEEMKKREEHDHI